MQLNQFLTETRRRLEDARIRDQERGKLEAHRFSVSNYLRTDELGLSRIIGDLLDPTKPHGQGAMFLGVLLGQLQISTLGFRAECAEVQLEKTIDERRRLDIYIRIPMENTAFGVAIENKPFAADARNQVKDYAEYLERIHEENFLLLYLSGYGQSPSEWGLGCDFERFKKHTWIVPYCCETISESQREKSVLDFAPCSVISWISACHDQCRAEKLQWFLDDIRVYCERKFGGQAVTRIEQETLRDFLLSCREHSEAAREVFDAWPTIKQDVQAEFLKRLCETLSQRIPRSAIAIYDDIEIGCKYRNRSGTDNRLWLFRRSWTTFTREGRSDSENRTSIRLESTNRVSWRYGVSSPLNKSNMTKDDCERRDMLNSELKDFASQGKHTSDSDWWPLIVNFDRSKSNWDKLVYELHQENQNGPGEITNHYVDALLKLAEFAIPKIDNVDGCERT